DDDVAQFSQLIDEGFCAFEHGRLPTEPSAGEPRAEGFPVLRTDTERLHDVVVGDLFVCKRTDAARAGPTVGTDGEVRKHAVAVEEDDQGFTAGVAISRT